MSLKILEDAIQKEVNPNTKKAIKSVIEYVKDLEEFSNVLNGSESSRYTYGVDEIPVQVGGMREFVMRYNFDIETESEIQMYIGDIWNLSKTIYTNLDEYKNWIVKEAIKGNVDNNVDKVINFIYGLVSQIVKKFVEFATRSKEDLVLIKKFQELKTKVGKLHDFPPEFKHLYKGDLTTRIDYLENQIKKHGSKKVSWCFLHNRRIIPVKQPKRNDLTPFTIEQLEKLYDSLNIEYEDMKKAISKHSIDAFVSKEIKEDWLKEGKIKNNSRMTNRSVF